ncbi:peptidase propeptide and YpeB domain protein [Streptomyces sp. WAC 01529]|uniref:PepSY domain-containing protein n=1 Tax=Streptomyces sp. WAC 01529 TaxID=2203205 RepID=UPI000F6D52CD|nr:PepSY domain-containing protein [Streptomyces sp. WAC 01529]AZM55579.1 peptidase propeptide and YpeB domain protein [Streptomyces sp. WAC 01529]
MKRNIVIATVAAAALITGGTATALATTGDDETAAKQSSVQVKDDDRKDDDRDDRDDRKGDDRDDRDDAAENTAEAKAAKVTAADAIKAALAKTPGTAVSAELDEEDGGLVWGVDILKGSTWHEVEVDPGTGKVLGTWVDKNDEGEAGDDAADTARVNSALKGASTSAEDAARAGAAKGKVTSVDLDDDGKAGAWGVETTGAKGAESEWNVDLKTGKVTADRHDDRDHDGQDDHDDRDDQDDQDNDGSDD